MENNDYRERLARDAGIWQREGIISTEQERAILVGEQEVPRHRAAGAMREMQKVVLNSAQQITRRSFQ